LDEWGAYHGAHPYVPWLALEVEEEVQSETEYTEPDQMVVPQLRANTYARR